MYKNGHPTGQIPPMDGQDLSEPCNSMAGMGMGPESPASPNSELHHDHNQPPTAPETPGPMSPTDNPMSVAHPSNNGHMQSGQDRPRSHPNLGTSQEMANAMMASQREMMNSPRNMMVGREMMNSPRDMMTSPREMMSASPMHSPKELGNGPHSMDQRRGLHGEGNGLVHPHHPQWDPSHYVPYWNHYGEVSQQMSHQIMT